MKKLIFLFALLLLLNGCNNDDNPSTEQDQITDGGEIFTSQIVTINNNNVSQDEYNAKIGDLDIIALQSGDNEIMFLVPVNNNTGETIFEVPELDLKIKYIVSQPVLNATYDETIEPFVQSLTSFEESLDDEPDSFRKQNVLNSINLFEQKLADASEDEKRELAEFYFINKTMIDAIYETDYTIALASRDYNNLNSFEAFNNFKISVATALAASGWSYLAFSVPDPTFFTKLLAAGTAIVAIKAWYDSYDLFIECKNRDVFTLDFLIGSYPSSISGNENDIIIYSHNTFREDIVIRNANKISNSYSNSTVIAVSEFFKNLDVLGNIIWKINYVIDKINEFNPFSQIDNIPNASLENSSPNNVDATDDILNSISYTINDDNVTIDEISFQDGTMKTKLSINNQDIVDGEYLDTSLNFQFQDDFNNIQGSYPIRIYLESDENQIIELLQNHNWYINPIGGGNFVGTTNSYANCDGVITSSSTSECCGGLDSISFNEDGTVSVGNYNYTMNQYSSTSNSVSFTINIESTNSDQEYGFSGSKDANSESFTGSYYLIINEYYCFNNELNQSTTAGGAAIMSHF